MAAIFPSHAITDQNGMAMIRFRHLALCLALAANGCAAAVPGYMPPNPRTEKFKAAAPKGGGFDAEGVYHLTEQEQALDCKQLTGSTRVKIVQMRESANRAPASTATKAVRRANNPLDSNAGYGFSPDDDYKRDRARLATLNSRLVEKDCQSFDIDAELKPGNTNTPTPTIGDNKKPKR